MLGFLLRLDLVLPFLDGGPLSFDNLPLLVLLANDTPLHFLICLWKSEEAWLGDTLDLLVLLHTNKLLLVCLEAVNVLLLDAVLRVHAELVHGDAEETCAGGLDTGGCELFLSEAPAKADATVVTRGWAVDKRAKWALSGTRGNPRRAELASVLAADFAGWIVKEGLHTPLPVLAEVVVRDSVILANHPKGRAKPPSWRF